MAWVNVLERPKIERRVLRGRHLLGALICLLAAFWGLPRARAAWRLHDTAVLFADYGLCMAGPTGAVALRDQPSEFWRLVRRRLVASNSDERVFAGCAALAFRLTGASSVADAHQVQAGRFAEWGMPGATVDLNQIGRTLPDLSEMGQAAWPFLRSGVAVLVKPSLGAKEAMHPLETAKPGAIVGLQLHGRLLRSRRITERGLFVVASNGHDTRAVRSRDRGRNWTPTSPWQAALEGTSDRCSSDGSERAFGLDGHRANTGPAIVYYNSDVKTGQSVLGGPNHHIVSLGCDESAAVVIADAGNREYGIWQCSSDLPCRALPTPPILQGLLADGIDIARIRGAIVIAITQGPVVRVVSSRDEGRSYTPFTIALDHADSVIAEKGRYFPAQLLAIGGSVVMVEEAESISMPALALVSNDFGASWHAWN